MAPEDISSYQASEERPDRSADCIYQDQSLIFFISYRRDFNLCSIDICIDHDSRKLCTMTHRKQ
uniref:Uncharacterized protein n=1 Tax=Oryza brachyantha TaxID=4533 RepID=J3LBH5_ORYBR